MAVLPEKADALMRTILALCALLAMAGIAHASPVWCQLTNGAVANGNGCARWAPPDATYTQLDTSDPSYTDFLASQATKSTIAGALDGSPSIQITSGTPGLSGFYPLALPFIISMNSEGVCVVATVTKFCNGTVALAIPDTSGTLHTFTVPQFKNFFVAITAYRNAVIYAQLQASNGATVTLPAAFAIIP